MIKDIKRIDLQGNEYLQEVVMCDRCKNILEPKDFYYIIKLAGWHPVKFEPNTAYGLGGDNKSWHICEKCYSKVQAELNGEAQE